MVVGGDSVLALDENRGAVDLIAVAAGRLGADDRLGRAPHARRGFDVVGDTIVVSYKDEQTSGELGVLRDGDVHRLTDFAQAAARATPRRVRSSSSRRPHRTGSNCTASSCSPDGDGPHPVLLMIHGGPFAQYGWTVFDEAQVYAGAGYAVVYTNPRGSSGYGAAYGEYIRGDVGDRSMGDLMAMLDDALARPELDETRLGVLGGSHGGFMTSWIVGHTDRFAAAVSERAVNAIDSFGGSSDIGWGFGDDLYGPDPAEQHRGRAR